MKKSNRLTLPEKLEFVNPNTLRAPDSLVHKDNPLHIAKIAAATGEIGNLDPVLVGPDNQIIDGVARWKAAVRDGSSTIPILRLNNATPAEVKAIRLSLNKLQKEGTWDPTTLNKDLTELLDQGFNVANLGFDTAEIDKLIQSTANDGIDYQPDLPDDATVVSQLGDVFSVGDHLIACGDCRDEELVARLLSGVPVAMVLTDPPYNVPIKGHVSGRGRNSHPEFAMASGEMTREEFGAFLLSILSMANQSIKAGGYIYMFIDWRSHHLVVLAAEQLSQLEHINTCTWVKSKAGLGSFYRSQHEFVCVFRKSGAKSTNNIRLGKYGRNRSNVWDCRGANAFGGTREADLADHPTVKPAIVLENAIQDCTNREEVVLDLFGGSGSTMLAAERCGRKARLIEIEPKYVDVNLRRMRDVFGVDAIHQETGLPFDALREQRLNERSA